MTNLCIGCLRINDNNVAEITARIESLKSEESLEDCTVIVQLYDKSMYQVRDLAVPSTCYWPIARGGTMWTAHFWLWKTRGIRET